MNHPFTFFPPGIRKPVFLVVLLWTLVLLAVSQVINAPLLSPTTPAGIVSFEFAQDPYTALSMVNSWEGRARQFAAFGLGFDYVFMPSYALTLALACLLSAGRHPGTFSKIGAWLGWGVLLAASFDAIENMGLWSTLLGNFNFAWPQVSFWCALFKFTLILLGVLYSLTGWILPARRA